jgi:type II secretory pathway component PulK
MLALWLIVLLTVLGGRVAASAKNSTGVASNLRARLVGRYASESGVMLAAAQMRDSLATILDREKRSTYLNSLQPRSAMSPELGFDDERFSVVYVDVNSRLDINNASQSQLTRLFSFFAGGAEAVVAAKAIRDFIDGPRGGSHFPRAGLPDRRDLAYPSLPASNPLRSLEDLRRVPGFPEKLALSVAPYLTVDGDGRINRAAASDTVMAAAAGSVVDEPSRILVISRGWLRGQPLTHEIQAVYAIDGNSVTLVRWQERDL